MPNPVFNPNYETTKPPGWNTEPIPPVEESVEGDVYAYRGTQDHGVPSEPKYDYSEDDFSREVTTEYVEPKEGDPPIPVRIVESSRRELHKWRVIPVTVSGPVGKVIQLVGRNESRVSLRIQNNNATPETPPNPNLRVSQDGQLLTIPSQGWRLAPGDELSLQTDDAVFATVETWFDASWDINVVVLEEYRVAVK